MTVIGERGTFAIEYEFLPDPDHGKAALPEESLSWGNFAIWTSGNNICQYSYRNKIIPSVSWYLYPLLFWLADNWNALLYEEQAPVPTDKSDAQSIFSEYAADPFSLMNEKTRLEWYAWGQRHSLRACSNGGIFPNLFIRAYGDHVEFSWDNADQPGFPDGLFFTAPSRPQRIERREVKRVLSCFLQNATEELEKRLPHSPLIGELRELIIKNTRYAISEHLRWMIPALRDCVRTTSDMFQNGSLKTFADAATEEFIPAPVLMFGSLAPTILADDIDIILNALEDRGRGKIRDFAGNRPVPNQDQYKSGYSLALNFMDDFSDSFQKSATLENILDALEITLREEQFSDANMRGVALAGKNISPIIFINTNNKFNNAHTGKRFTAAHELCHLLFDNQYGQEVGISSGPWAPAGIEKRANAFAAMLLMPEEVIEEKMESIRTISPDTVKSLADDLQVSQRALVEHLHNLHVINVIERENLLDNL